QPNRLYVRVGLHGDSVLSRRQNARCSSADISVLLDAIWTRRHPEWERAHVDSGHPLQLHPAGILRYRLRRRPRTVGESTFQERSNDNQRELAGFSMVVLDRKFPEGVRDLL